MKNKKGAGGMPVNKLVKIVIAIIVMGLVLMGIIYLMGANFYGFFKGIANNLGIGGDVDYLLEDAEILEHDVNILLNDGEGRCIIDEDLTVEGGLLTRYGVRRAGLQRFDGEEWNDVDVINEEIIYQRNIFARLAEKLDSLRIDLDTRGYELSDPGKVYLEDRGLVVYFLVDDRESELENLALQPIVAKLGNGLDIEDDDDYRPENFHGSPVPSFFGYGYSSQLESNINRQLHSQLAELRLGFVHAEGVYIIFDMENENYGVAHDGFYIKATDGVWHKRENLQMQHNLDSDFYNFDSDYNVNYPYDFDTPLNDEINPIEIDLLDLTQLNSNLGDDEAYYNRQLYLDLEDNIYFNNRLTERDVYHDLMLACYERETSEDPRQENIVREFKFRESPLNLVLNFESQRCLIRDAEENEILNEYSLTYDGDLQRFYLNQWIDVEKDSDNVRFIPRHPNIEIGFCYQLRSNDLYDFWNSHNLCIRKEDGRVIDTHLNLEDYMTYLDFVYINYDLRDAFDSSHAGSIAYDYDSDSYLISIYSWDFSNFPEEDLQILNKIEGTQVEWLIFDNWRIGTDIEIDELTEFMEDRCGILRRDALDALFTY